MVKNDKSKELQARNEVEKERGLVRRRTLGLSLLNVWKEMYVMWVRDRGDAAANEAAAMCRGAREPQAGVVRRKT